MDMGLTDAIVSQYANGTVQRIPRGISRSGIDLARKLMAARAYSG